MDNKKVKLDRNAKALIGCQLLNTIIDLFLSTFFIAHILSVTNENISTVAIYYIISYVAIFIFMYFAGHIIKKTDNASVFRAGMIIKFFVIMTLILLGDNMKDYIFYIAPILALSNTIYWAPCDNIVAYITKSESRVHYGAVLNILIRIVTVVFPIVIGASIDAASFLKVANYILVITGIQVIVSLFIKVDTKEKEKFELLKLFKSIKDNPQKQRVKNLYKSACLFGFVFNLIPTLITILIVNNYEGNFSLGLFQTIFAFTSMIAVFVFKKNHTKENLSDILVACGLIALFSVIMLVANIQRTQIIIYYFINITFTAVLDTLFITERMNNEKNGIPKELFAEHQTFTSMLIQVGRVAGYGILLISSLFDSDIFFKAVLLIATSSITLFSYYMSKLSKS